MSSLLKIKLQFQIESNGEMDIADTVRTMKLTILKGKYRKIDEAMGC
jgi:hypothetical protein